MLVITGVIYLINYVYGIIKKKSQFFSITLVVLMTYLMCSVPSYIPDYSVYESSYETGVGRFEWGYSLLSQVFYHLGFSFFMFRLILLIFSMIILYISVRKYTDSVGLFFSMYLIFPFFMDIVQIRNFVMMCLLIFASTYMFEKSYKNFFKALVLICLAASFHSLGYFYILALLLEYIDRRKIAVVLSAIILILTGLGSILLNFKMIILSSIQHIGLDGESDSYVSSYILNGSSVSAKYYLIAHAAMFIFVVINYLYCKSISEKNDFLQEKSNRSVQAQYIFLIFMVASLVAVPLYQYDSAFFRIVRDIFPMMILSFVVTYWKIKELGIRLLFLIGFTGFASVLLVLFIKPVIWDNTIRVIFG